MDEEKQLPQPAAEAIEKLEEVSEVIHEKTTGVRGWLLDALADSGVPEWLVSPLGMTIFLAGILVLAWLTHAVVRPLLLKQVRVIVSRSQSNLDDHIFGFGIFRWVTHFAPAILVHELAPGLFSEDAPWLSSTILLLSRLYMIFAGFMVFDSMVSAGRALYRKTPQARKIPASALAQVLKLIAFLVALILTMSVLFGKSPLVLIGGMGIFASVLMLIFKDPILGFTAGIQLTSNEMVAPGDLIEVPGQNVNGEVLEVGLTTVKVRNGDKTISAIPTQALITESFRNWRGMSESGVRRIMRALFVDIGTIRFCDEEMLERFAKIELLSQYVPEKQREVKEWNLERGVDDSLEINGRRLTNIGTFRAYVQAYLENHPPSSPGNDQTGQATGAIRSRPAD